MFQSQSDRYYETEAKSSASTPLHNINHHGPPMAEHAIMDEEKESPEYFPGAHPSIDGTWGERDMGGPVTQNKGREEFETLRRELTNLTQSRTNKTERGRRSNSFALKRSKTGGTERQSRADENNSKEEDDGEAGAPTSDEDDFPLADFLRDGHFEKREDGQSAKKVGVVYKNLTVQGVGAQATFVKTLPHAVVGTFGPDLYRLLSRFIGFLPKLGAGGERRDLIHDFTGVVRDGEMLLVLGRPGAGCSTFLKAIANKRAAFASVTGTVSYGGITAEEQGKNYKGEVIYNEEDDQHLAQLSVEQTIKFSLMNKTKKHEKGSIPIIITALLKMFGISHTRNTPVGNGQGMGVSGGERKRVSIIESLSTKSTVVAWDNSTRGLDASTALDYANSLRILTDVSNRTTLVSLYQAGESIYKIFDKVLVIDQGRMIYQGPTAAARAYFESIGYRSPARQTTPDFLTACTDPVERRFRDDFDGPIPKTPAELEKTFRESSHYQQVLQEVGAYEKQLQDSNMADARQFKESVKDTKSKTVSKRSNYTVSFWKQVVACTKRELWLTMADTTAIKTKAFIIITIGLIVGSLFYGQSLNTSGAFSRGGILFFSCLFLGWLQLAELMKAMSGRVVTARHREYAFYRPSAVVVARFLQDLPVVLLMVVPFSLIVYFLTDLSVDAGKFFIYLLFVYVTTICITSLYRMFAALSPSIDDAVRYSGIALITLVLFTGYVIPKLTLLGEKIWFGWLFWVNPLAYSFEALITDEFYDRQMACAPGSLVPNGPGYDDPAFQGCAFSGAQRGSLNVNGRDYLSTTYNYSRSHLWRNFGVVIAFIALYLIVTAIGAELFDFSITGGGALEFKKSRRSKKKMQAAKAPNDLEKSKDPSSESSSDTLYAAASERALQEISTSESVFTWENVNYSIPTLDGEKQLLHNATGYAKPGVLLALMGASGAGKTTLLNTLSQRTRFGVVTGDMLVDGRKLGSDFARGTGFAEQMDLHDMTATIREALEFSAILRQDRTISREDKIAYVDKIIDLLELGDIEDSLIRSLGVEQRKRVTIGVELAARPKLLLFLDEPTSGLDSQSAFNIIRFLRKLCHAGQAIICTIHQPSTELIEQFDEILALNPGGNTFYYGSVGNDSSAIIKYFNDRGIEVPPKKNIAEFILETAAKGGKRKDGKKLDWNQEWLESDENKELHAEIARLKEERSNVPPPTIDTQHAFAAPVTIQCIELTKRVFKQYWRSPSYLYGKLFVAVIVGLLNGFTFWQVGNTVADFQNRMFSIFIIIVTPPTIINGVLPKFYMNRALWEYRELPSRLYGWFAFCTANIVAEFPMAILSSVLYWALWYWPSGLPTNSAASGYSFLMVMLFFLFTASWGQWICSFTSSFTVISNVLPLFLVVFSIFNGVVVPYSQMSVFWRYWLYYLNPSTYYIGGVLGATMVNVQVECSDREAAYFDVPTGSTCRDYAADFVTRIGRGYLTNPDATSNCGYCPYRDGTEYLATLHIKPSEKWRDFGIFLVFCFSNWFLVYFLIYTVRIRGWTFGFSTVSKYVSLVLGTLFAPVVKLFKIVLGRRRKADESAQ